MSDKRNIRIGIVGSGGYGSTARRYLNNSGQYDIVACMDSDADVAGQAAREEKARSYHDLETFLGDPNIEAVSINTPVILHAQHIQECLEAHKHIFVTKPVTPWLDDARRSAALAREKRLVFMVGHTARYSSLNRLAQNIIASGKLGVICNVVATCCCGSGLEQKQGDWRTEPGQNPGGPVLQCGIHIIDLLISLFGRPIKVAAMTQKDITQFDVEDNVVSLIQFHSGVQVAFVCNYTSAYMHTMDILGTAANLHLHGHITGYGQEEAYIQPREHGTHEPWQALIIPGDPSDPDHYSEALEKEFSHQIRTETPDYSNLDDAISALHVLHAMLESHRTAKIVDLE